MTERSNMETGSVVTASVKEYTMAVNAILKKKTLSRLSM
jgi:hypothetical protein